MTGATEERSFVEEARRAKLPALEALGVPPFAYRFDRTHTSRRRARSVRRRDGGARPGGLGCGSDRGLAAKGKTVVRPPRGRRAAASRSTSEQDLLGAAYELVKLLDLDDHVGVDGHPVPDQGR